MHCANSPSGMKAAPFLLRSCFYVARMRKRPHWTDAILYTLSNEELGSIFCMITFHIFEDSYHVSRSSMLPQVKGNIKARKSPNQRRIPLSQRPLGVRRGESAAYTSAFGPAALRRVRLQLGAALAGLYFRFSPAERPSLRSKHNKNIKMSIPEGKGSARKSKQMIAKTSLNNPYALQWRTMDGADMHFILEALEEAMKRIGFKKIELRRRKKPCSGGKQEKEPCHGQISELQDENGTEDAKAHGWTDLQIRNQLAIGINEVTRALEKNELVLVLVCKSAKPAMLTSHLIPLSASRAIPAAQVPRLSESLAPVLGLTSVLALGLKRNADAFAEVAKVIIPRIPSLNVPWIQDGTEQTLASDDTDLTDKTAVEIAESNPEESSPCHKRKRRDNCKLASPNTALQALRVKKIVPNPNKKRKLPKTKKRISK
ncbi:ribonuclease P protein subunit p38 [Elgaria multicarinata webbii]|uniref:ribonuclease P protein subunit p38 n=1 Tax=Elgaria multicarinata webbii TaxID=159646 RepID=UPI002FCCCCE9